MSLIMASLEALSKSTDERRRAVAMLEEQKVSSDTREGYLKTLILALGGSLDRDVDPEIEGAITVEDEGEIKPLAEVLKAFWRSAGDSEVALLDDLYSLFQQHPGLIEFITQKNAYEVYACLHIIMSSNMGPCIRCQARIRAFLQDLGDYARYNCKIGLLFDIHYLTAYTLLNREGYGYDPKRYEVSEKEWQDGLQEMYWSVSFQHNLDFDVSTNF